MTRQRRASPTLRERYLRGAAVSAVLSTLLAGLAIMLFSLAERELPAACNTEKSWAAAEYCSSLLPYVQWPAVAGALCAAAHAIYCIVRAAPADFASLRRR